MNLHRFENLIVHKDGVSGSAEWRRGAAIISFELIPHSDGRPRSFVLSNGTEKDLEISSLNPNSRPIESDRQDLFEKLLMCLLHDHPGKKVPNTFMDSKGQIWKLDKVTAHWALENGFRRGREANGMEFIYL